MHDTTVANGILTFTPAYFGRVWGGDAFREKLGLGVSDTRPTGEAWLIADHPSHESRMPGNGATLRDLMEIDATGLLGRKPLPARGNRFPLLLKLLDCHELLSVQVHPDDALADRLGEADGGKTEMWYFLEAEPDAEIICGLAKGVTRERFQVAAQDGSISTLLRRWPVKAGDAALVSARTVHALGKGLVVAEIQQTSDVTYRVYDWDRVGANGQPRELHLDKALECIDFNTPFQGLLQPKPLSADGHSSQLCRCNYFAADLHELDGPERDVITDGDSFHILLSTAGNVAVAAADSQVSLQRGQAALVPGRETSFTLSGNGSVLDFHVL
ncbi:MAG: Mannose-6-phosphate isomerase ManA [Candidatus Hydrogenedentota bacterium]|jgi:mannose-6-phosphate isomerase